MSAKGDLMAPLSAVTPPRHMAHLVASRSYLSYSKEELRDKLSHNPYSYVQVIHPDVSMEMGPQRGTTDFFQEVKKAYKGFKSKGWLKASQHPEWYIYRQQSERGQWTGVVCNLDLALCATGGLQTHEQTLDHRESLFASFLETVGFHAEPILCARPDGTAEALAADEVMVSVTAQPAHTDFMTADGHRHEIWRLSASSAEGEAFGEAWRVFSKFYLADGHHRFASSLRVASKLPDVAQAQSILALVVPERDLTISGFHKEIREIEEGTQALRLKLEACRHLRLSPCSSPDSLPSSGEAILLFQGQAWQLTRPSDTPYATDAHWIQEEVMEGVFGITDPRDNPRLRHLPAIDQDASQWWPSEEDRLRILMPAIPFADIRKVADAAGSMPPKSTWVEPKLRSAMFIHEFSQGDESP